MNDTERFMKNISCIIDESGTLPDPNDKTIIMAAVGVDLSQALIDVYDQVRKEMRVNKKGDDISEIKFYHAGERTKKSYLKRLISMPIDIFALVVDKQGQAIPDTPENYAVLSYLLIEECILFYKEALTQIIFDKHFHREVDQVEFDKILKRLLGKDLNVMHAHSIDHHEISAADMIAGSLLWKYTDKDSQFYHLLEGHIITETIIHWKEAKRRFIEQIKNST